MTRIAWHVIILGLLGWTSACKTQAYQPHWLHARTLEQGAPTQTNREQGLDAAQSDYIESLPGLGMGMSPDRLGKSAWASEKFKVSASCRDTFQLTIEGSTIRNITNFQTFEGCVALARVIDNLELPSTDAAPEDTPENTSGGSRVTSSCRAEYFTLRVSEGTVHINSDYLLPNADACLELRNRINSLKL